MESIYHESNGNSTKVLLNIIKYGDIHFGSNDPSWRITNSSSHWVKVNGCMSNVWIGAKIVESYSQQMVSVEGEADSRIARGMLAIIIQGFYGCYLSDLTPSAFDSIRMTSLYRFFPTGRINGFTNMLSTIQSQIFLTPSSTAAIDPIIKPDNSIDYIHLHSPKTKDIAVLLSGGVDSSLALTLAQESGMKVHAFYLKIWLEDELAHLNECPWEEDMKFAEAVTSKLGVQLDTVSLQKEYWSEVVSYTLAEAKSGRTPNPDIMCNSRIKFGMFYEYVGRYFNHIATGHYAQVSRDERGTRLITSPDEVKDQTYFLSNLRQDQLSKAMFPIGHLSKPQVRELSKSFDLPTQSRKDSQGICFLGKLKFDDFIRHYLGDSPGVIRCYQTNQVLGHHRGLWYHTIGQRKGIGLLLNPNTLHLGPYYVASKDMEANTLYVTNDLTIIDKPRKQFTVHNVNWILDIPTGLDSREGAELKLKLRHSPTFVTGRNYQQKTKASLVDSSPHSMTKMFVLALESSLMCQ
eukprot:gene19269-25126_t